MRIWILQHVAFEGAGYFENGLAGLSAQVTPVRLDAGEPLPDVSAVDGVLVMGGPMGVGDDHRFPWLKAEKRFLATLLDAGKPLLGICLGAQLLASVLGARVYRNPCKEMGWLPVEGIPKPGKVCCFPSRFMALHWHGDTFDLPVGSQRLARSEWCENQAFAYGKHVMGVQFHLEATAESVKDLVAHDADALASGGVTVHSAEQIHKDTARYADGANVLAARVLEAWWPKPI